MPNRTSVLASLLARVCLTSYVVFLLIAIPAVPAQAQRANRPPQEPRLSDPPTLERDLGRVLGGVPMTAADSMQQRVVRLLDFDSYKELVRGLTQFGDRTW